MGKKASFWFSSSSSLSLPKYFELQYGSHSCKIRKDMFFIFSNFFRGESNVLLTISFSITYFAFSGICLLFDFDHANAPSIFS